ncbi:unnamed protein product, partial [marine sediment metagenome]
KRGVTMVYANVITFSHIAANDLIFRLSDNHMWFREANMHIVMNDALYGDVHNQPATITAGDVLPFQDFDLSQMWFKNAGAAANTTIHVVGILMSTGRLKQLEIPIDQRGD